MKSSQALPRLFGQLIQMGCAFPDEAVGTEDGFIALYRPVSRILEEKGILDFPDSDGERLLCESFFDDWYLYAVSTRDSCVYSLLKLREQEHDAEQGLTADGDTPGVTVSFIAFSPKPLIDCLNEPTDENRVRLSREIDKVVARSGQRHHRVLKDYFKDPASEGAYLTAALYVKHIASFATNGSLEVPKHYGEIVQESHSYKSNQKLSRLPDFIDLLNRESGYTVCDHKKIFISCKEQPTEAEGLAIMATHTGNVSLSSFAAEVEYHARFLFPLAKIPLPFFGKSVYASAVRADMTVDDTEFEGPAPFYRADSRIVKRQRLLHGDGMKYLHRTHASDSDGD